VWPAWSTARGPSNDPPVGQMWRDRRPEGPIAREVREIVSKEAI